MNLATPLQYFEAAEVQLNVRLYVKRDDLFPVAGGGNKARKIGGFLDDMEACGCNAVVTNGGLQSNHARVTARVAAERGWACHLILHGDPAALERPAGNLLLAVLAGASVEISAPARFRQRLA